MANVLTQIASEALSQFNETYDKNWSFGNNYTSEGTDLDVFFNKVLFPKIAETNAIIPKNGNRFNWLVKEVDLISQLSEDYVILDSIPIGLNLNKSGMIMFETNFRRMASKLYNVGNIKKSILYDVYIKESEDGVFELHLDLDDANACFLKNGDEATILDF